MFVYMVSMDVMKMAVVEVVDVVSMTNGRMPAIRAVDMCMVRVFCAWRLRFVHFDSQGV